MTITIRQAGPGDEAAIVRLTQEMAAGEDDLSPIDERYARRFLASPVAGVLLAEDGGEVVGLLSYALVPGLYHAADSGLIELLIVTGTRRGEGIGHRLVDTALRAFHEAGCAEASVSTGEENASAQKVYRDAGLTESSLLLETHFEAGEPGART
jgi:ribosomal protein S18 acetylase RimI-like enzyme